MSVEYDTDAGELRATRELRRSGNSVVLSFPPALLDEAGLELGDHVVLTTGQHQNELTIEKATTQGGRTQNE